MDHFVIIRSFHFPKITYEFIKNLLEFIIQIVNKFWSKKLQQCTIIILEINGKITFMTSLFPVYEHYS